MSGLSEGEVDSIRADLLREMAGDEDSVDWAMRYIGKHVTAIVGAREAAWRGEVDLDVLLERQRREVAEERADLAERQMMTALETVAKWRGEVDGLRARVEALADEWWSWSQQGDRIINHSGIAQDIVRDLRAALEPAPDAAGGIVRAGQHLDGHEGGPEVFVPPERRAEAREQDPHTDWPTRGSKG